MRRMFLVTPAVLALGLGSLALQAQTTVNLDFNSDPAGSGVELRGNAAWRASGSHDGSGYVSLTDAVNIQSGKMLAPDLDPTGVGIGSWTATMKIRIGGSTCCTRTGGNGVTASPADGMSFSFANADDPAVLDGAGGGWLAGGAAEEGTPTGLSICLDTWDNGGGEAPNLDVKVNGAVIATIPFGDVHRTVANPPGTSPLGIRTGDGWADLSVSLSACGGVTVAYKGVTLVDKLATGLAPVPGRRFIFGGRTGNANDAHWIDDVVITADPDQLRGTVSGIIPASRTDARTDSPVGFILQERLIPIDDSSIVLTLDGATVAHTITATGDPGQRTIRVEHQPAAPFGALSTHTVGISFQDIEGEGTLCGVQNVFKASFISPDALFIEAEDFNYSQGEHIEFGAPDGSMLNLGVHATDNGIDFSDGLNDDTGQATPTSYRKATGVEAGKGPSSGTGPGTYSPVRTSGDTVGGDARGSRTIEADWAVGWTAQSEWANYTRTFPGNSAYNVYVRWGSGAGAGTDMTGFLDEVTSDPSLPNQTLRRLGRFFNTEPTGAWDGAFIFSPLTDAAGAQTPVRLSGTKTLRYTIGAGAQDYNYLVFVPCPTCPKICPTASASPDDGSIADVPNPTIRVVITDGDTRVLASSIRLTVNGTDVTSSPNTTVTDTPTGAEIAYNNNYGPDASVTASATWTDDDTANPCNGRINWSFRTSPLLPGTLFIEAEDFNYGGGQHIEFGAPDGSMLNLGDNAVDNGIDYQDGAADDSGQPTPQSYRKATGVEAGKGPTSGTGPGTYSPVRSGGDTLEHRNGVPITASWVIGWTGGGEFANYSRTFPEPARRYNVYVRWTTDVDGGMSATLSEVTSDPSQPGQSLVPLGTFNGPDTVCWDCTFRYDALRDGTGEKVALRLGGLKTLRYTIGSGHDYNFLAFVPAPPVRARVCAFEPDPRWVSTYGPIVKATIADEDTAVIDSSVRLFIDGTDVTAQSTVTDAGCIGGGASIAYQLAADEGRRHTARVTWDDGSGVREHTWSFRQGPRYDESNLFIEAEDFNTGGGEYFPSKPGSGFDFNAKGLYNTLGATHGVDYNEPGSNPDSDLYRSGESPNVNMAVHNDADATGGPYPWPPPGGDMGRPGNTQRPGFDVVADHKVGWNDGGDWRNYTRTYPAGEYSFWARLSSGGGDMHAHLDEVIGQRNAPDQTLQRLGEFHSTTTANWDGFTFVPLVDANGNLVKLNLSGERTLRYTIDPGAQDVQYFMLVPPGGIECPPPMTVNTDPGRCCGTATFTVAGADSCTPPSGTCFPIGTTTVTCTGGGSTCSFTVTVEDHEAPTMNCPQTVTVGTDPGQCSAVVNDYGVSATDCPGTTINCSPPPGSTFPVGSTSVTCTATDAAGNSSSCTFNVVVEDREAPQVAARPGSNPAGKVSAKSEGSNGFYQLAAMDNCDPNPQIYVKDANSNFVCGPYSNGTLIKLVPNAGSNKCGKGAGELSAHINTAGNAEVYAVDSSGNRSAPQVISR